jgi:hypothetical protein
MQSNCKQMALQNVAVAVEQSIQTLDTTAGQIDDPLIATSLSILAARRWAHLPALKQQMCGPGEFIGVIAAQPAITRGRAESALTGFAFENSTCDYLIQRIDAEQHLLGMIEDKLRLDWSRQCRTVLDRLAAHIRRSVWHLREVVEYIDR